MFISKFDMQLKNKKDKTICEQCQEDIFQSIFELTIHSLILTLFVYVVVDHIWMRYYDMLDANYIDVIN
jgi:hypothetical protein